MEAIKQILLKNGFTIGLLNKFVAIAKIDRNNEFYLKNLDKVLEIRTQLLKKDIIIKELEVVFENSSFTKKVGVWGICACHYTEKMTLNEYRKKFLEELVELMDEIDKGNDLEALTGEFMDVVQSGVNYLESLDVNINTTNQKHIKKLSDRGIIRWLKELI